MRVALVGNPNAGKSSVFNRLTGLRQKTGNYPGVTVDKKTGYFSMANGRRVELTDLPGTYSIYARSADERIVISQLLKPESFDLVIVVADATNLRRHLLLYTQVRDLGLPVLLVINMFDLLEKNGWKLHVDRLAERLGTSVIALSARTGNGIDQLKKAIQEPIKPALPARYDFIEKNPDFSQRLNQLQNITDTPYPFRAWQYAAQPFLCTDLSPETGKKVMQWVAQFDLSVPRLQAEGIATRFAQIDTCTDACLERTSELRQQKITRALDRILVHPILGFVIFFGLLLLMFQAIFSWSAWPMDAIDEGMAALGFWLSKSLPDMFLTRLLTDGLLPGITGVLIFVPQIGLLFLFISLLEESGYMARVVFIMDRLLRPFGLNGRSVVPLISGAACAIPAIMSARTIDNEKERVLTILVTPFITCSARLPIYVILIALVVPASATWAGISIQAWALMALYLLGAFTALGASWVINRIMKKNTGDGFVMEMPLYKTPQWKNVAVTLYERSMAFVTGAGKIILSIAMVLWLLASFGPNDKFYHPEKYLPQATEDRLAAYRLEHSFIGYFGKGIEPAIAPLGYNWKIGIALLTSFAAREVFVGTMATIYGLGEDGENESGIIERMRTDTDPATGAPIFGFATAVSLLLFYAFAMQCMSTLAIVKRELKSWKYPVLQLIFMTALAYLSAWMSYAILS
jgi:ferrous iron transport protein B